ncbi:mandelate racemase/muconate lactonizing enzyme family protein [Phytoactinopolyspora alkaliphila]|uniref:Mandelate racemase/muconate lactonizing enzyme family protein n=1 Tax=Phytoactinopolyspora alkaliphila TaxID=1783498 RepID=A0A6N9YMC4_9ACTN|nr:mandelate racemase/muconate lactonizing enzyme family protein [Phytoactinopolyspora alkaliphila]NED96087.1 mandelate racemase/muconate lactonizing enzyme family protein [Phytoactinopolyspora alkaliphila]
MFINEQSRSVASELSADDRLTAPPPPLPASSVAAVTCRVFRTPVTDGVAMSFGPLGHRVMAVVVIELADGSRGMGESWVNYPAWAWRERVATIDEGVAPLVVGREFTDPVAAHEHLVSILSPIGRQWGALGPIHQAISAVDTALWDIAARHAGVSLADALGGSLASELPVYGSSLGPAGVETSAQRCLELGLTAVKVKLGFGAERDESNLRLARAILGQGVEIFGDANQAWSLTEALEMAPLLRDVGVAWIEEPISGDDPHDLARLREAGGVPVATGENLYGAAAFAPYIERRAADIVQPDLSKVGGPTEYLRVHELAHRAGVIVNPHLYNGAVATAATIQVAAAVPGTGLVEWDIRANPMRAGTDTLLTGHGTVRVPDGPGLGLDIDLDALAETEEAV